MLPHSTPPTKRCAVCGRDRPAEQFSRRRVSPDGLARLCKDCDRADKRARRERYAARPAILTSPEATWRCTRCGQVLLAAAFPVDRGRPSGRGQYCRPCAAAAAQAYRRRHPERVRERKRATYRATYPAHRAKKLERLYGLTRAEYEAMLAAQGGGCAICGTTVNGRDFAVDHDHATGAIRGLLCDNCNKGLGCFGDDPARLRAAAAYLRRGDA